MSNEDLTERLAGKLATLDLADDEAALLVSMFQQSEDEVAGFASRGSKRIFEYQDGTDLLLSSQYLRSSDISMKKKGWIDLLNNDWG